MDRSEIYDSIVESFYNKYSWLGEQVAEEMLLTASSWNLQHYSNPDFRLRRHLLLFWPPAWIKSSLLMRMRSIFGNDLCGHLSDISTAAMRGSVESGRFRAPECLKHPFTVCTEFGQLINSGGDSSELVQKLLNLLEEGVVTVSLIKAGGLLQSEREKAIRNWGIEFDDDNNFTYHTDWVILAGTYNKKFLADSALESRFNIVTPHKKLDSELTKYINRSPPFHLDDEVKLKFRDEIFKDTPSDIRCILPDSVYSPEVNLNVRESSMLISAILNRRWWGKDISDDEIIEKAKAIKATSDNIWRTPDDKVFDAIFLEEKSVEELCTELDMKPRSVTACLRNIRATPVLSEGLKKWRVV